MSFITPKLFILIFLVAATALFSACAHMSLSYEDELLVNHRLDDLVTYYENNPDKYVNASNKTLRPKCMAYDELNDFKNLYDCLNKMHENYNSGDLYSLKFPGWQQEAMSDVYSLKADSLLKQERYTESIQFYEKASGYCNCIWNRSKSKNH